MVKALEHSNSYIKYYWLFLRANLDNGLKPLENEAFKIGQLFASKEQFKQAVKTYDINNKKLVKFERDNKDRVNVQCMELCPWKLRASKVSNGAKDPTFQVKIYVDNHTCCTNLKNPKMTATWLSQKYLHLIQANANLSIPAFEDIVYQDYTIIVPRVTLWRTRELAKIRLAGTDKEQYKMIGRYIKELEKANERNTTIYKLLDNGMFDSFYVCLAPCKQDFIAGCRPIMCLDGCWLKGRYGGQLLTAIGIDANDCIYPIAWATVGTECKETWTWGKGLKDALWSAARATIVDEFERCMQKIKELDVNAYNWLVSKPPQQWSKSRFDTYPKCDSLVNNLCECFNRVILDARDRHVLSMNEEFRSKLMKRFYRRRKLGEKFPGKVCPRIVKKLMANQKLSGKYWPEPSTVKKFQVRSPNHQYIVDLDERRCSCRRWDLNGIACAHAIAAISHNNEDLEAYIAHWYSIEMFVRSYACEIDCINGQDMRPKSSLLP
ncbi:hypothetical protein SLEP1_g11625 [Rubroshorea leprosula]|nr:hypothetical protein SLEP1_g11625 [Rubroshorea leprosula]